PYIEWGPLEECLGATLQELQRDGDVNARLHVDMPLDGELVTAEGEVTLRNNSLFIEPLDSTLKNLSGKFSFINGDLQSEPLTASWFKQPLNVDVSAKEG
ncbi:YhdP family protein, partial [Escherichia coli]|uniref:YhdP family protein n=1 Tax=Escherichia coli TaxID=562 RepID=UPI0011157F50